MTVRYLLILFLITESSSIEFLIRALNAVTNYGNFKWPSYYFEKGYGTEWIYFPDGKGIMHLVNLTQPIVNSMKRIEHLVSYRLYTRNNINNYIELDESAAPTNPSYNYFVPNAPVKLITHGWISTADTVKDIRNAYLKRFNYNVVAIDWSQTAENYMYPIVALETSEVGRKIGRFIDALNMRYGVRGDQVHLIGHSLGAHVVGIAASQSRTRVGRVTGLDPARPLFEFPLTKEVARLDQSDADFVDVIHTCGGLLGVQSSTGHADFYPNNGLAPQPGCYTSLYGDTAEVCSHGRSVSYFAESILYPNSFRAVQCNSWEQYLQNKCNSRLSYMGEYADRNNLGTYYLMTNSKQPYNKEGFS